MKPEQVRMGRALLNWSLDQLANESRVHRNTISNFEIGKYAGNPETLASIRSALEARGVIFVDENDEGAGVRLRRLELTTSLDSGLRRVFDSVLISRSMNWEQSLESNRIRLRPAQPIVWTFGFRERSCRKCLDSNMNL